MKICIYSIVALFFIRTSKSVFEIFITVLHLCACLVLMVKFLIRNKCLIIRILALLCKSIVISNVAIVHCSIFEILCRLHIAPLLS